MADAKRRSRRKRRTAERGARKAPPRRFLSKQEQIFRRRVGAELFREFEKRYGKEYLAPAIQEFGRKEYEKTFKDKARKRRNVREILQEQKQERRKPGYRYIRKGKFWVEFERGKKTGKVLHTANDVRRLAGTRRYQQQNQRLAQLLGLKPGQVRKVQTEFRRKMERTARAFKKTAAYKNLSAKEKRRFSLARARKKADRLLNDIAYQTESP